MSSSVSAAASRNAAVLAVYTAAIFLSALLLFSVQPLFTKMVLPRLGGSPAVWSVAMAFFQTLLLAGYAYAHWLTTLASRRVALMLHLALLAAAFATLPLAIAAGWGAPPAQGTALWLFGLFAVSIGLPFFALAANNPLLQAWFARSGHPDGRDPYFLYASSNIGSFLALLSYPLLIEPLLTLHTQNLIWTAGYALLIVLIAACGVVLLRGPAQAGGEAVSAVAPPPWRLKLRWVFLAAVPSGLLVAVTAHISTDVAAAPLLWVVPLSLYLLTWVLVFQSRPLVPHRFMLLLLPLTIGSAIMLIGIGSVYNLPLTLGGHLACFFIIAMACHGELARTRPAVTYLTGFYVALSFGGMIGGLFAGLAAPYTFSWVAEYPILIAAAVLCLPAGAASHRGWRIVIWPALAIAAVALVIPAWRGDATFVWIDAHRREIIAIAAIAAMIVMVLLPTHRLTGVATVALALMLTHLYPGDDGRVETVRSFFGVHKIVTSTDGRYRVLMHGTTIHGAERIPVVGEAPARPELISYYHADGGFGQAIAAIRARKGAPLRVAVIGLGAGTLACAAAPGEHWRFFEIDPLMIETARNPRHFTFVDRCDPDLEPVVGDARLTFAGEPDGAYDLVVVDAYSSDAIPIHLATQEAMAVYKSKLAPQGAVLMHVSNRHLALSSVAVGIAAANGLASWVHADETDDIDAYIFATTVVLSARDAADIGALAANPSWRLTPPAAGQRVWTDDYSNVLGALWRRWRGGD